MRRRLSTLLGLAPLVLLLSCATPVEQQGPSGVDIPAETKAVPAEALTPELTPEPLTSADPTVPQSGTSSSNNDKSDQANNLPSEDGTPAEWVHLVATVWEEEPRLPILNYHQFSPESAKFSTAVKTRLPDLQAHLQSLYDSGYSLVSLEDWLKGDLHVPEGRRPLIITMDDLFYNNQLSLTEGGDPDPSTGIGVMWEFSQAHPDFGFQLALFANLGDKLYANPSFPTWEDKLGEAIAWGFDHGAITYNHFYTHPHLDQIEPRHIVWNARKNDEYLRSLLEQVGRDDIIPSLSNIFALPYSVWPTKPIGVQLLLAYENPEGLQLQAVMESDFIIRAKFLPPPYAPDFDRWHILRIIADHNAIDFLVENSGQFPTAVHCEFENLDQTRIEDRAFLAGEIRQALKQGRCPEGVYSLGGKVFTASSSGVHLIFPEEGGG